MWSRFGDVQSYVEPFAGSLAVLLARPHTPKFETVNDIDCHIANVWRAITFAPEAVADFADYPVNEADLHARHLWLIRQKDFIERMKTDPDYYDPKIAGWWIWGVSSSIRGTGNWCLSDNPPRSIPSHGQAGVKGVHSKQIQDMGVQQFMIKLASRLRNVRVICGDWKRVMTPSAFGMGTCGVVLDPPYFGGLSEGMYVSYKTDANVSAEVRQWAIENGSNPKLRIALCGYDDEHTLPSGWEKHEWKAVGGFGLQRKDGSNQNQERERVWFSPGCLKPSDSLFHQYEETTEEESE